ncbi:MAG: hypothetical protein K0S14_1769 [Thermomicrobiales bacterium]|nr:hypothetical protein [Thermomicrobiales bacterium]MDF3017256.1 hypothetical protein [Thermomicrobiales bacterium]
MTLGPLRLSRTDPNAWRLAAAGLVLAAAIVGLAIVLGGPTARLLNPIGALLWLVSAVLLGVSPPPVQRPMLGWIAAIAGGLVLGALIRPSGLIEVIVWFAVAGAAVVFAAEDRVGAWALLVPAIYLPVHLLIGIGRAILRNGGVRTDPPPTAAIVPLAMLLAAAAAGALIATIVRRNH